MGRPARRKTNIGRSSIEHTARSMLALQRRRTQKGGFATGGVMKADLKGFFRELGEDTTCHLAYPPKIVLCGKEEQRGNLLSNEV